MAFEWHKNKFLGEWPGLGDGLVCEWPGLGETTVHASFLSGTQPVLNVEPFTKDKFLDLLAREICFEGFANEENVL